MGEDEHLGEKSNTVCPNMKHVAIIGGGVAGLAAGCALADAGERVTLIERKPFLGGRASSYEHPGTGEVVDNCQHVLLGCCTSLIDLYRRIGAEGDVTWFDTLNFMTPGGKCSEIRPSALPAPSHSAPSFLRAHFLSLRDKVGISRALAAMAREPLPDNGSTFLEWLRAHGQTENALRRFWEPVLVSALNEDLDRCSLRYASLVFRDSFLKSPQAGHMGVPCVPLSELYGKAQSYIERRGGAVRLRSSVDSVDLTNAGVQLELSNGEQVSADAVIVATPWLAAAKLVPSLASGLQGMQSSPITGIHLWFDRRITDLPHAVLLDRTIQWMFHKSVLQRDRPELGSYVEVVVSASRKLVSESRRQIIDLAVAELSEYFPVVRQSRVEKAVVVKEFHATFSVLPGSDQLRPKQMTADGRVFLAGDWTDTGWPATMEGAARSGYSAASVIAKHDFSVADLAPTGFMRMFA